MKVFPNELENQKDFDSFTEWLQTFELYRGKQGEEGFQDEARVVGQFKVSQSLRNWNKTFDCQQSYNYILSIVYYYCFLILFFQGFNQDFQVTFAKRFRRSYYHGI